LSVTQAKFLVRKILRAHIALTFFPARTHMTTRWQDKHELADRTFSPRVHATCSFRLRANWIHQWRVERVHCSAPACAYGRCDGALASARRGSSDNSFWSRARQF